MSTYNQSMPHQVDQNLIGKQIETELFLEFMASTSLFPFMGHPNSSVFVTREKARGSGEYVSFPLLQSFDHKQAIYGSSQLFGNEKELKIYSDSIKIGKIKFGAMLPEPEMAEFKTPIDVFSRLRPELLQTASNELTDALFRSMVGSYSSNFQQSGIYNKTNTAITGVSSGPVKQRAVYGSDVNDASKGKYDASIYTACNGMSHNDAKLSVDHLLKLKKKALSKKDEMAIQPFMKEMKNKQLMPQYIYFCDPASYLDLRKDPDWRDYMYRGMVDGSDQPEGLTGAMYRGKVEGIYVYECPELEDYRAINTDTKTVCHNVLLGSQAVGVVWGKKPVVREGVDLDYKSVARFGVIQIRGQKALMYPSKAEPTTKQVERGIIHSFVLAS